MLGGPVANQLDRPFRSNQRGEISLAEAARIVGCKWHTLERLVDSGRVEARIFEGPSRRRIYVPAYEVNRLLKAQEMPESMRRPR